MKKLVLILVCAVIMTVLIALNFLLWDKEANTKSIADLKSKNDSKDASIEVLGNEIKNTKNSIDTLNQQIQRLEKSNKDLLQENDDLKKKGSEAEDVLKQKNAIIDKIKVQIDLKPFETILKKWADNINDGQYFDAYELMQKSSTSSSMADFIDNYQKQIKSIKIKSIKLFTEDVSGAEGNIVFNVSLDIKLLEGIDSSEYNNGINERYFTMNYDTGLGTWLISTISVSL